MFVGWKPIVFGPWIGDGEAAMTGGMRESHGPTVGRVLDLLDGLAPFSLAEEWDNVGLMVGDPGAAVTGILVALDVTAAVLDEATRHRCNLVVSHHPAIFHPISHLRTDQPTAALAIHAVTAGIAVIGCHTNLDKIDLGVNGALATALGLAAWEPLEPSDSGIGFGLIGDLPAPAKGSDFVLRIGRTLGCAVVKVAGPVPERVVRVAACGGSGSDLAAVARDRGADIYCSGEIKHAIGRWAEAVGFCVVDAGHWATEQVVVAPLAAELTRRLAAAGMPVPVRTSEVLTDVFASVTITGREGES